MSNILLALTYIILPDSGGPRSYSQLKILKDFMHRVQWDKYPDEPDKVVLPSEYFHLIGGSDMGGLVASSDCITTTNIV